MKEVITMWKYPRMVILVGLSTIVYAGILLLFKAAIVIVPGITEARPANVFPIIFGLMFGPAGAWGSAFGNLIGDVLGGTVGWGSLAGFAGNFYLGFIPYKLWCAPGLVRLDEASQNVDSWRKMLAYCVVTLIAATACAVIIAWDLDWLGLLPFSFTAVVITLNNSIIQLVFGPPLLLLLYTRFKQSGLVWTDIMAVDDVSRGMAPRLGSLLMVTGALGGLAVGLGVAGRYGQALFSLGGLRSQRGVFLSVLPFLLMMLAASFMLSGREQFKQKV